MNLDTAANTINLQSNLKIAEIQEMIYYDYTRRHKNWSTSATSEYTISFGEGLMQKVRERAPLYNARRVGMSDFDVVFDYSNKVGKKLDLQFSDDFEEDLKDVPIPVFDRVRRVVVEEDGTMLCGCCRFEGCGYFCEQHIAVADLVYRFGGGTFPGFTKHDCDPRYLSEYMHLGYQESTPDDVYEMWHELSGRQLRGPKLMVKIPDSLPIEDELPRLPAIDRLKNYKKEDIDMSKFEAMHTISYTPPSQRQSQHSGLEEDDTGLYKAQYEAMKAHVSKNCTMMFEECLENAVLPEAMSSQVKTRERLGQNINEACDLADNIGTEAMQELETRLKDFREWCLGHPNYKGRGEGRNNVPMTGATYQGTRERNYNTHDMRSYGRG